MYLCDYCGCKFRNKQLLSYHILIHTDSMNKYHCRECNLYFSNKNTLSNHLKRSHPTKYTQKIKRALSKLKHRCEACDNGFTANAQLKYHIRSTHFNLVTNAPYCNFKEINEVWFERVINTNILVEIKKIDHNNLLIQRVDENATVKPTEMPKEVIDLRMLYPTHSSMNQGKCRICKKEMQKKKLRQHIIDEHNVLLNMKCDKCNIVFKRFTACLSHVCPLENVVN